ncbi:RNA-binding S4 domain-containing protein [Vagococcus hydrophili]|uniref:RQC P-site tRNA stabilizing factor n=1 Tax=Vagococcus hydrophili TaxID=2714947 RepID=A0A6G8ASF9_9ENTE|nr:RNA-binding S4 domain-containing protein [Vagococcus hydrophili]QIL47863.1 RNA-binding S4 domain-containing protein [Vagococcus hydrophili]
MRLDKYLKVSRIIKRRTVAKEIADKGRIQVNGQIAKSSTSVKVGDLIKILFGNKTLEVRVLDLKDTTKKDEAKDLYEIVSETRETSYESLD